MSFGQVSRANSDKRRYENMSDEQRKAKRKKHCEWVKKNRNKINKYQQECRAGACDIIKKHHEDTKDDPESLTTEFIQMIIGVDCDK